MENLEAFAYVAQLTAAGQMVPVYIAITGSTEDELDPIICPSGFLPVPVKVPNLCKSKGGADVHCNGGFGWLMFMRGDDKKPGCWSLQDESWFNMALQKHVHYNEAVLRPFIKRIRKLLGWKPGNPIPEWLRAC